MWFEKKSTNIFDQLIFVNNKCTWRVLDDVWGYFTKGKSCDYSLLYFYDSCFLCRAIKLYSFRKIIQNSLRFFTEVTENTCTNLFLITDVYFGIPECWDRVPLLLGHNRALSKFSRIHVESCCAIEDAGSSSISTIHPAVVPFRFIFFAFIDLTPFQLYLSEIISGSKVIGTSVGTLALFVYQWW